MSARPSMRIATNLLRCRATAGSSSSRHLLPSVTKTNSSHSAFVVARSYSDAAAAPPPLLQKIKGDLKTAMRAKDAPRLSVVRGVLAATLNASKTDAPVSTDAALVGLLRKHAAKCAEARAEFAAAGRDDLAAKEDAQIAVLDEYIAGSGFEEVGADRLAAIVKDAVASLTKEGGTAAEKPKMGDVMKVLLAPGGPLDGLNVAKAELARIVKNLTGA
ncbi:Yqey-like protein-domain-containing protein [Xylariaceae sp. FL0594]|nr:Yqey-like protein-domain-containing protein [Xylariaceae sp. FL0594]